MSAAGGKGQHKRKTQRELADEAFEAGLTTVRANSALYAVRFDTCRKEKCALAPRDGLVRVDSEGVLHAHPDRLAAPDAWAWAIAHAALHLGFGHVPAAQGERAQPDRFDLAARCVAVNRFLLTFPVGLTPENLPAGYPDGDETRLAARWRRDGLPAAYGHCGTAGGEPDQLLLTRPKWQGQPPDWQLAFAHALTSTMSAAMDMAGGRRESLYDEPTRKRPWEKALSWFISSYPLLGGIAAGIRIVADVELAHAHGISVAAVDAEAGEIYINPLRQFEDEEWRFILAHEMLHAALRHGDRCGTRDPYLFNVAADYVINDWLREMQVGTMPDGLLYDSALAGLSAEEVYDRIVGDPRRTRRLSTLRGKGAGDILGGPLGAPRDYVDLDEFYRRGLARGSICTSGRSAVSCPRGWSRRSVPSVTRRCPGTPDWPAGSTSSFPHRRPYGPMRVPRAVSRPLPTFRAPDGTSRPRRSPAAPSESSSTPPAPWSGRCSARRWARSPRTPRPVTYRPPGSCSATPPRTTRAFSR